MSRMSDHMIEVEEYLHDEDLYLVTREELMEALDKDHPTDTFFRNSVVYLWEQTQKELNAHYDEQAEIYAQQREYEVY